MRNGPRPPAVVKTAAFGLLGGPTASEGSDRVGSATSTRVDVRQEDPPSLPVVGGFVAAMFLVPFPVGACI
jgi:hypothetical protein